MFFMTLEISEISPKAPRGFHRGIIGNFANESNLPQHPMIHIGRCNFLWAADQLVDFYHLLKSH